jgi:hypothetical protein
MKEQDFFKVILQSLPLSLNPIRSHSIGLSHIYVKIFRSSKIVIMKRKGENLGWVPVLILFLLHSMPPSLALLQRTRKLDLSERHKRSCEPHKLIKFEEWIRPQLGSP